MSVVKEMNNHIDGRVDLYLKGIESESLENKNPEELLEIYKRENEFLKKKLRFYAHLNSHQLRAPLVQIIGLTDMLKELSISKREKLLFDYLEIAAGNMDEMIRCINRVLQVEADSSDTVD